MQRDDPTISWHDMTFLNKGSSHNFIVQADISWKPVHTSWWELSVQLPVRHLSCLFAFHSTLFYLKIMTNIILSSHFEHSSSLLVKFFLSYVWKRLNNESSQVFPGFLLATDSKSSLWLAVTLHRLLPPDRISVWRYQHLISPWQ